MHDRGDSLILLTPVVRSRQGQDAGAPVADEYRPPFPFTGTLRRGVYDVSGKQVVDHEAEIRIALARQ